MKSKTNNSHNDEDDIFELDEDFNFVVDTPETELQDSSAHPSQTTEESLTKPRSWFDTLQEENTSEESRAKAVAYLQESMPPIEELAPTLTAPGKEHLLALARPLYEEVKEIIVDMREKRQYASYAHLVTAFATLMDKLLILSGQATSRVQVDIRDEEKRKILTLLAENTEVEQPRQQNIIDIGECMPVITQ